MDVAKAEISSVQRTQKPTELQRTQAQERSQRPTAVDQAAAPPAQPVVNTQGQTTGRLLNVTA